MCFDLGSRIIGSLITRAMGVGMVPGGWFSVKESSLIEGQGPFCPNTLTEYSISSLNDQI